MPYFSAKTEEAGMMAAADRVHIMVWKATIIMLVFLTQAGQLRGSSGEADGSGSSSRVPCRCMMYAFRSSLM